MPERTWQVAPRLPASHAAEYSAAPLATIPAPQLHTILKLSATFCLLVISHPLRLCDSGKHRTILPHSCLQALRGAAADPSPLVACCNRPVFPSAHIMPAKKTAEVLNSQDSNIPSASHPAMPSPAAYSRKLTWRVVFVALVAASGGLLVSARSKSVRASPAARETGQKLRSMLRTQLRGPAARRASPCQVSLAVRI